MSLSTAIIAGITILIFVLVRLAIWIEQLDIRIKQQEKVIKFIRRRLKDIDDNHY